MILNYELCNCYYAKSFRRATSCAPVVAVSGKQSAMQIVIGTFSSCTTIYYVDRYVVNLRKLITQLFFATFANYAIILTTTTFTNSSFVSNSLHFCHLRYQLAQSTVYLFTVGTSVGAHRYFSH